MLRRRGDRSPDAEIVALEAAHLGLGDARGEPGIFARPFDDAAPARIARHVEHRREGHGEAVGRRLDGRLARRALPDRRVERRGLGERHREHRAVAVDDVEADHQRNAEPRLLDGDALQRPDGGAGRPG